MDPWFLILATLFVAALLRAAANLLSSSPEKKSLPPGPLTFPVIGNFLWLRKSSSELEPVLRSLHARHGSMVTLHLGSHPTVFVSSRALAHEALVHCGAVFADRPPPLPTIRVLSANQHNISSTFYGPTWRLLRRNLTAEILHPSRVRSYSHARAWVLNILVGELKSQPGGVVRVVDHFQYAMFFLLVLMCFGDRLEEKKIKQIMEAQRKLLLELRRFNVLNFWPWLTKLVFRKRWKEFNELWECRKRVLIPLIRAQSKANREQLRKAQEDGNDDDGDWIMSYVDTLLDLELPEEKRKLEEGEIMGLCSEFLNAGTDTTSTALQWIMANLVKYPEIQQRLYDEIKSVVGQGAEHVKEEDLQRMGYLKAVVLEGLRRHPPGHFVLPHAVTQDAELGGYVIPKDGTIDFMVAEMGWDPEVWEDPMAFKPERFLICGGGGEGETGEFDIRGSREIKMMPFGVGRRMCPGYGLAMLQLEYFVANLVWLFQWRVVAGEEVDLSEKEEFTTVMKNPLRAQICPQNWGT
ncbi:LOW QUALITY PROTEIN: cytochrome P450 89A2 [Eucalyptus grandis]|uniref:LOW QUALITY PROTEIN: cytochrome P450 89A2 n=1 Tax=Eucalyptus grandis TaxID=71139 RepID=UPI00192EEC66|nr:LOW QUALITY PROTEIN: cytochrome P450 89A2 [Eucalyptus grandis]